MTIPHNDISNVNVEIGQLITNVNRLYVLIVSMISPTSRN